MKFSLYIAKRYLFTKSSNNAINIISRIASMGVIFGSMLLLIVLSGFAGLKTFTLSYSSVVDPDFKISAISGKRIVLTPEQLIKLQSIPEIISYTKAVEERVFLEFNGKTELATFKGVDEQYQNTVAIDSTISLGKWLEPKSAQTVVGEELAFKLGLGVFDYSKSLKLLVPKPGKGQLGIDDYNTVLGYNVGLFHVNDTYKQYLFISLETAQQLLGYDANTITDIELKTTDGVDEAVLRDELNTIFDNKIIIKNKLELNDAIHKMLNTENIAVYLIFTLILIIALFNVIGAIIMMIIDKKRDLITLSNLGTPISDIKQIFFLQGALLTFIGGSIGAVLGVLLVGSQVIFEYIKIPGTDMPYPVELTAMNILIVLVTIFSLGLIASKVASYRISKKMLNAG
ncbi:MAG: ABC transporter permease [Kordia sp.]|nr:MAG: ABC transporter permease [Kordia sp.]